MAGHCVFADMAPDYPEHAELDLLFFGLIG
jgi:hypothetical protein